MLTDDDFHIQAEITSKAQDFHHSTTQVFGAFGKLCDLYVDNGVRRGIHVITLANHNLLADLGVIRDHDVVRLSSLELPIDREILALQNL